ncbi:MAG: BrnA antitoxin family protein [Rhodobacteraceae bacterium]|nr:BrnA antitoxin family protein [Paracoccaceae bacterium]
MKEPKPYIDDDGEVRELDEQWFKDAKPTSEFPELVKILRGRPKLPDGAQKKRVTMFLDRDIIEKLKADGKGWQTRANAKLREALGL